MSGIYLGLVDTSSPPTDYDKYMWISGNYCNGIAWCEKNKKSYFVCDEGISNSNIYDIEKYLKKVQQKILKYICLELNDYLGTNYSTSSWELLLEDWLEFFLTSLYDKYLKIDAINTKANLKNNFETIVNNNYRVPIDTLDFYLLVSESDKYNSFLYGKLIEYMDIVLSVSFVNEIVEPYKPWGKRCPEFVDDYEKEYRKEKATSNTNDDVVVQCPYFKFDVLKRIMKESNGRATGYFNRYFSEVREKITNIVDFGWRKEGICCEVIEDNEKLDSFEKVVFEVIKQVLPIAFVEGFRELKHNAECYYKYALKSKLVVSESGEFMFDERFKVFLMELKDKKTKISSVQHGGGYGLVNTWQFEKEYNKVDVFFNTGWKEGCFNDTEYKIMPFIKFLNIDSSKFELGKQDILYVGYNQEKYLSYLSRSSMLRTEINNDEDLFFKSISEEVKKDLRLRMYMYSMGDNHRDTIIGIVGENHLDEIENFYESLKNSRIMISSLFETTALEALFLNIPILMDIPMRRSRQSGETETVRPAAGNRKFLLMRRSRLSGVT